MGDPQEKQETVKQLAVRKLQLTNFRSYKSANLQTEQNAIVITGDNGSGKTNLLEAVSLLAPGRGIRSAKIEDLASRSRDDEDIFVTTPWAINAEVESGHGNVNIGTAAHTTDSGRLKRIVKIDGEKQRGISSLAEYFSICYLTPRMDSLFVEGAHARRDYLDNLTSMLMDEHSKHLAIYNRSKSDRLKLLKGGSYDPEWMDVLENRMVEKGVAIAAARIEAVSLLQQAVAEDNSPFPKGILSAEGMLEKDLQEISALQAEQKFKELLNNNRDVDAKTGRTNAGINSSDFCVIYENKGFRAENCSTGEQKSMLLALTLASIRAKTAWSNMVPVLLLDEVVAHLDEEKRAYLMAAIEELGSQCWMTGTDTSFFAGFQGKEQFLKVANSSILG